MSFAPRYIVALTLAHAQTTGQLKLSAVQQALNIQLAPFYQGAPGPSAYQHWLSLGNAGTMQDFINSLQGPAGTSASISADAGNQAVVGTDSGIYVKSQKHEHTQTSPTSPWIINHNLGFRPAVSVWSVGGLEMMAEVLHVSANQLQVYFDQPMVGSATCS